MNKGRIIDVGIAFAALVAAVINFIDGNFALGMVMIALVISAGTRAL